MNLFEKYPVTSGVGIDNIVSAVADYSTNIRAQVRADNTSSALQRGCTAETILFFLDTPPVLRHI